MPFKVSRQKEELCTDPKAHELILKQLEDRKNRKVFNIPDHLLINLQAISGLEYTQFLVIILDNIF